MGIILILIAITPLALWAAVVPGTNSGFVTVAPSTDPAGTSTNYDEYGWAQQDTSPAGATTITEIGWYCDTAVDATDASINFEVGLYDDNAGVPNNRLYVDNSNALGEGGGWKTVTVSWAISGNTVYHIAVQLDDTATATNLNYTVTTGDGGSKASAGATTLTDPWVEDAPTSAAVAFYALYESSGAATPNTAYYRRRM